MKTTTKSLGCLPSARPTDLAFGFCLSKASFRRPPWGLAPGGKTTAVRSTKAVDKGSSFRSEAGFQSASGKKERLFAHSAKQKE